jgi:hypothetical protein
MPTTRAQAAEEEYFRNQEAERREDDVWSRQRAALEAQVERHRAEASRSRRAAPGEDEPRASQRAVWRGLNRLIVAGWDECLVFDEAIRLVAQPGQGSLRQKVERRRVFRRDLSAAVATLGGVSARGGSPGARCRAWLRGGLRLLTGPHEGDAYSVCFRAAENAAAEYSRVLGLGLPADVRFGVERQYAEVTLDCQELRRRRWGASAGPATVRDADPGSQAAVASPSRVEPRDAQALDTWNNEGGALGKAGAAGPRAGPG